MAQKTSAATAAILAALLSVVDSCSPDNFNPALFDLRARFNQANQLQEFDRLMGKFVEPMGAKAAARETVKVMLGVTREPEFVRSLYPTRQEHNVKAKKEVRSRKQNRTVPSVATA